MWQDYDKAAYAANQQRQEAERQRRAYEEQTRHLQEQQAATRRQAEQSGSDGSPTNRASYQVESPNSRRTSYEGYSPVPKYRLTLIGQAGEGCWYWICLLRAAPTDAIWKSCLRWILIVVLFALSIVFWALEVALFVLRCFVAGWAGR